MNLKSKAGDLRSLSARFTNLDTIKDPRELLKLAAEGQDTLATLNDCTRARKCNLVPKSQKDRSRKVETADHGGCCAGQTGHHLINGAMIKGADCPAYKYETAPTVCAEGFSQNHGSHKRLHDAMDQQVQGLANATKLSVGSMSMSQTITGAAHSHAAAFPLSRCSEKCIREQFENYYECPNATLSAVDKAGGTVIPDRSSDD